MVSVIPYPDFFTVHRTLHGLTYIIPWRFFSACIGHDVPNLVHAQNLGIREYAPVQRPRIGHDLSNVLAHIGHIRQSKLLVSIFDDAVVDVDHVCAVGPARRNFRDIDLIPAAHVNEGVRQARPLDLAEDFKFLSMPLVTTVVVLFVEEDRYFVLDVDDAPWGRANPLRRHETLHTSFLRSIDPRDLLFQMFPGDA